MTCPTTRQFVLLFVSAAMLSGCGSHETPLGKAYRECINAMAEEKAAVSHTGFLWRQTQMWVPEQYCQRGLDRCHENPSAKECMAGSFF